MNTNDRYCQTCGTALTRFRNPVGVVGYAHSRPDYDDHPPVPVPLDTLPNPIMFCDFCSRPHPPYRFAAATPTVLTERHITQVSRNAAEYRDKHEAARETVRRADLTTERDTGQWWSACTPCAALVEAQDLDGLVSRATDALPAKLRRSNQIATTRAHLRQLHEDVLPRLGARQDNPYFREESTDGCS